MKGYVSVNEAIEAGYGSRTKLWRLVKQGKLPAFKNGRNVYYKQEDLEALLEPALSEDEIIDIFLTDLAKKAPELSAEGKQKLADILRG